MFLDYYGLRELPFGVTPDPRFYYASRSHREALACLTYAVECRSGFAALVAEPGMGKTMLLRRLLQTFEQRARTAFLLDTDASVHPLPAILSEFGVSTEGTDHLACCAKLKEIIVQENRAGRFVLLIIDEAQNLEGAALESIRLLSNFETDETKLLQIVLGGQPRLAEKLCTADLRQLYQRIPIGGSLQPLDRAETELYVVHRLKVAGHSGPPLLTAEALDMIARESDGIPRQINSLCFNALSLACALRKRQADAEVMREVLHDFRWAQHIAAQQQAAAQRRMSHVEAPHQVSAVSSQGQRGQAAQAAAGYQAQGSSIASGPVTVGLAATARPPAAVAGLVALRETAKMVQRSANAMSPAPVAQSSCTPLTARIPANQMLASARRSNPVLVVSAVGMVLVILVLLVKQTGSGSAVIGWASARVKSAFRTDDAKPAAAPPVNANRQPDSTATSAATRRDGKQTPSKPSKPASTTPALRDRAATSALGSEQADSGHEAAADATEVVVRHPRKLATPVSDDATRVILEPETAPTVAARSASGAEIQPRPPVFEADVRPAAPVLSNVPASSRVRSGATPAVALSRFVPGYPEIARRWAMQGTVLLEAVVDTQGRVKEVRPLSGPLLLVEVATKAVKQWRYQPAVLNGQPIESTVQVSIRFELSGSN